MSETRAPAKRPCGSCPYRKDVPSGVWAAHEYAKLIEYDNPTASQPLGVFGCHQRDGRLCAGWIACHPLHGPYALLSIRLNAYFWDREVVTAVANYETDVEVWESGAQAALHGLSDLENPSIEAIRMIDKIERLIERRDES